MHPLQRVERVGEREHELRDLGQAGARDHHLALLQGPAQHVGHLLAAQALRQHARRQPPALAAPPQLEQALPAERQQQLGGRAGPRQLPHAQPGQRGHQLGAPGSRELHRPRHQRLQLAEEGRARHQGGHSRHEDPHPAAPSPCCSLLVAAPARGRHHFQKRGGVLLCEQAAGLGAQLDPAVELGFEGLDAVPLVEAERAPVEAGAGVVGEREEEVLFAGLARPDQHAQAEREAQLGQLRAVGQREARVLLPRVALQQGGLQRSLAFQSVARPPLHRHWEVQSQVGQVQRPQRPRAEASREEVLREPGPLRERSSGRLLESGAHRACFAFFLFSGKHRHRRRG